jgi:hypothetical protein
MLQKLVYTCSVPGVTSHAFSVDLDNSEPELFELENTDLVDPGPRPDRTF